EIAGDAAPLAGGAVVRSAAQPEATSNAPIASRLANRAEPAGISAELDVGGALVLAPLGGEESGLELAGIGRPERDGEERILADRLRRVELRDVLPQVRHHDTVDEVIVSVDRLAVLALDDLHGMDHEHAGPDDLARLDARRDADPNASDVGRHA